MIRGIYTAAAGMLATSLVTDTLASNLANVSTVGYKGSKVNYEAFPSMMINRTTSAGQSPIGSLSTGSKIQESFVNYAPGTLRPTGNTFDMALEGDGFFTVKTPGGQTYYTRAGNFTVNDQGFVTTTNGDYVQGHLGNIQLNLDKGPIHISSSGTLTADGRTIDTLKITRFVDNQNLEKVSDNVYEKSSISKELPPPGTGAPEGYMVHQGTLEESNVNPVSELVNNIQGMRLYEALQKNITMHNQTLEKAVNDVGRATK